LLIGDYLSAGAATQAFFGERGRRLLDVLEELAAGLTI